MRDKEKARINKIAIICHSIIDLVLLAAYLLEWMKGSKSAGYFMIIAAFTILPVLAEIIIFRINKSSNVIHHIMGVCYSAMYIFIMFTTPSSLAFTYAIPMYMVASLYSEIGYSASISAGGLLSNVVYVINQSRTKGIAAEDWADLEIRLACMALSGIFMVLACYVTKKINEEKLANLNEQKEKTNQLLEQVLSTSDSMIVGIADAAREMELLGESVELIRGSMREVNIGNNETADAVQHQQQRTEQIQDHIAQVRVAAEHIDDNMVNAAGLVADGREQMSKLREQASKSLEANELVQDKMQGLDEQTEKMNSITEIITGIANRTGILALNARIEAARAGEAGKGFAVVAGEISSLASQTKSATVDINGLIKSITEDLGEVSKAIEVVAKGNQSNEKSSREAMESFLKIAESSENIARQSEEMKEVVENLEGANADIVGNIQTISAVTEEVTAHSNETYDACEENSKMVGRVSKIVKELNVSAQELKKHTT